MVLHNKINRLNEISILDFPKKMFVELPTNYRDILFQLVFLELKNTTNVKKILKEKNLCENLFRWRRGYDRGRIQFINLESLLYLLSNAHKSRNKIKEELNVVKTKIRPSEKRIEKTKELISLIKNTRYILKGNNNFAKRFNINPTTLPHYISNKKIKKLPLSFIIKVVQFLDEKVLHFSFSIDELQDKIISYKAHHGKRVKIVSKGERRLPIKVTPEFESIIYHLLGDGHVKEIGSGEYTQLNVKGRNNFLYKLYNVFGHFNITKNSFENGRIIIPKAIINILCKYYNLDYKSFHWDVSKLPSNIMDDKKFKIAGLSAFIIDEGHVSDRGIELYSSNKVLLSQIRNLVLDLKLNCSQLTIKKKNGNTNESFRFRIRKESSVMLINMVKELKKKYPFCGLAQKEDIIKI